jgi:GntR family transcriptional regulator
MRSDRPAYRQLADLLRDQIASGELPPGALVPSEARLMQEHGLSRNTIRLAIGLLRSEGLVDAEHGRGTRVRKRPPVRRLGADRYRTAGTSEGGASPFASDHDVGPSELRLSAQFRETPAGARLAHLLDIEADAPVLERSFVFFARGEPQQMSTSCYRLEMVANTPLTDPSREPWTGGSIAQLASIGVTVTRVTESVTARMPMPDEAETLLIGEGVPVVVIERRMFAGDRPVEAADIVIPADRVALDYEIQL